MSKKAKSSYPIPKPNWQPAASGPYAYYEKVVFQHPHIFTDPVEMGLIPFTESSLYMMSDLRQLDLLRAQAYRGAFKDIYDSFQRRLMMEWRDRRERRRKANPVEFILNVELKVHEMGIKKRREDLPERARSAPSSPVLRCTKI